MSLGGTDEKHEYVLVAHRVGDKFDLVDLVERDICVDDDFFARVHRLRKS